MTTTDLTNLENKLNQLESTVNTFISNDTAENDKFNSTITSVNEALATLKSNVSSMENMVTSNTSKLDTLKTEVDNAEHNIGLVGGLNLINNATTNFGVNGITSSGYGFAGSNVNLEAGKTYTLTVCGCSSQEAVDNGQYLAIELFSADWSIWHQINIKETTPTVKQVTFTIPKTQEYLVWNYAMPHKANSNNVTVYWYNVQEGEVGTAWVPSIYDLKNILAGKDEM